MIKIKFLSRRNFRGAARGIRTHTVMILSHVPPTIWAIAAKSGFGVTANTREERKKGKTNLNLFITLLMKKIYLYYTAYTGTGN